MVEEEKKKEEKKEKKEEALESTAKKGKEKVAPSPLIAKTGVAARLDKSMKAYVPVNRSSDLVPLTHEFHTMRKNVRDLIDAAKRYDLTRSEMDKARLQLAMALSAVSEKSPIHAEIGSATDSQSFVSVNKKLSNVNKTEAVKFKKEIIDYVIEWESIISKRVDAALAENGRLHERLNHYQNKVENLRKKTVALEDKGKAVNKGLTVKLERNEGKLDQAWIAYERHASKLCRLLEDVTVTGGWKDLYPLAASLMTWETRRASEEFDMYAMLTQTKERMGANFLEHSVEPEPEMQVVAEASDHDSQTTGSYHPHDEASVASSVEVDPSQSEGHDAKSPKSVAAV